MSSRKRVLVIDDDPLFRGLIVSLLRNEFLVMVAKDGAEGYYRAIETRPDVAIIDVNMPGWDGIRTLKAIREHRGTADCKVMMLTGDATRGTVVSAIRAGADDYLIKTSFTNDELLSKMAALTHQGTTLDEVPSGESTGETVSTGIASGPKDADAESDDAVSSIQAVIDDWD